MPTQPQQPWSLTAQVGGPDRLESMLRDFYERVFADAMIGFLFADADLDRLVDHQVQYVRARLGNEAVDYTGTPIRRAHQGHPILVGHFDRRHQLLKDVLDDYDVPDKVVDAWVALELNLRDLVIRTGDQARDAILDDPSRSEAC